MRNCTTLSQGIGGVAGTITAATLLSMLQASAIPLVWINEIHYDNAGTDVNEFVEVAGEAGVNLDALQLLLYNGGDGKRYSTLSLSGTLSDQQNGFGTSSFSFSTALQNGAPDGVVLYDSVSQTVIQFLSYEGSFTATDGPANGMTSIDLGVAQEPAPAAGMTLSLTGSGRTYLDFTWSGPVLATPGDINIGQTFVTASTPIGVPDKGQTLAFLALAVAGVGLCGRRDRSSKAG